MKTLEEIRSEIYKELAPLFKEREIKQIQAWFMQKIRTYITEIRAPGNKLSGVYQLKRNSIFFPLMKWKQTFKTDSRFKNDLEFFNDGQTEFEKASLYFQALELFENIHDCQSSRRAFEKFIELTISADGKLGGVFDSCWDLATKRFDIFINPEKTWWYRDLKSSKLSSKGRYLTDEQIAAKHFSEKDFSVFKTVRSALITKVFAKNVSMDLLEQYRYYNYLHDLASDFLDPREKREDENDLIEYSSYDPVYGCYPIYPVYFRPQSVNFEANPLRKNMTELRKRLLEFREKLDPNPDPKPDLAYSGYERVPVDVNDSFFQAPTLLVPTHYLDLNNVENMAIILRHHFPTIADDLQKQIDLQIHASVLKCIKENDLSMREESSYASTRQGLPG